MISLKIKGIEGPFDAIPGSIHDLVIESPNQLYSIVRAFFLEDEETIIVSKDSDVIPLDKSVLFIKSLFDLDPNSKKILSLIYKQANVTYLNDSRKQRIIKIQDEILDLLDEISLDFNYPMTFDRAFGIDKIMQASSFCFSPADQTDFFDSFVSYLRAIQEISKAKFIVCMDIFAFLEPEKVELLSKELGLMGFSLINLASFNRKKDKKIEKVTVIDTDYCEI